MDIVTHSVSFFECQLAPKEWRIVLLFRNVWPKHVEYLKRNPNVKDKYESKKKKVRRRRTNVHDDEFKIMDEDDNDKKNDSDDDVCLWDFDICDEEDC